jgi:transcriptional regulator with XRE-family HTH domain
MAKPLHAPDYATFARLLREARLNAGLSQVELAERLGEDQSFVSKCERGIRRLDVIELRLWTLALGVGFGPFVAALDDELSRPKPGRGSLRR